MLRRPIFGAVAPTVTVVAATPRRARSLARAIVTKPGVKRVRLGATPFVLDDGGVRSGFANLARLAKTEGGLERRDFGEPLTT